VLSTFLSAVPIEMKRHQELGADRTDSSSEESVPGQMLAFFQEAIDNQVITSQFTPEDLLVSFLGGVMGMSLFQPSIQIGSVRQASAVTLAMLKQQFLTD
jgi:hypothetical protein